MAKTRPVITLNESVIYNPNPDCEYQLVSAMYPQAAISVTFEGVHCKNLAWVDFAGMQYSVKGQVNFHVYCMRHPIVIPDISSLPLLMFQAPNKLYVVTSIHFIYKDSENVNVTTSGWTQEALTIDTDNARLQTQCIKLLNHTPVRIPEFPIVLPKAKPNSDILHTLFSRFIAFNNDEKLKEQSKNTDSHCHIRAHFVSMLLNEYGIVSFKVFKHWNRSDWKLIRNDGFAWSDHCAVGILDSENKIWIWDPWVNLHHKLLTLAEWTYQKDEPKVTEVVITNKAIINPVSDKNDFYPPHFSLLSTQYVNAFQAVCGSAIPFSKHLKRLGLFQSNPERALIPYVGPVKFCL